MNLTQAAGVAVCAAAVGLVGWHTARPPTSDEIARRIERMQELQRAAHADLQRDMLDCRELAAVYPPAGQQCATQVAADAERASATAHRLQAKIDTLASQARARE